MQLDSGFEEPTENETRREQVFGQNIIGDRMKRWMKSFKTVWNSSIRTRPSWSNNKDDKECPWA